MLERRLEEFDIDLYVRFADDQAAGGEVVARVERSGSDLTVTRRGTID